MFILELKDAVSDLLISTKGHRSVIVLIKESSVYLCVTGIHNNTCIIINCKEEEKCFKDNEPINRNKQSMRSLFTNIWKLWKGELINKNTNMFVYLYCIILFFFPYLIKYFLTFHLKLRKNSIFFKFDRQ